MTGGGAAGITGGFFQCRLASTPFAASNSAQLSAVARFPPFSV